MQFKDELELKNKCKEILTDKKIRSKYFTFLYSFAKENVPDWDYNKIYDRFIKIIEIVKTNNMI